ncbi:glycosyltransferase [Deminuibacter soli]|uniref:Glycosyltransferase n=1 Tax=Deminuibacter soli TaxID=2291815 RepID=A0A3E1NEU7_9BACT|nr:glycosyltransferase [Deminuibacter soli]RFM26490.1 glycosyltransferase [Deminuibacter soli]
MNTRISVITICFNNLEELKVTCASVDMQTTPPYEHWIIDGSSNNEIRDYLQHTPQPAYRKWLCERDRGIADAFNKGVLRATGDIVNMLNSADYYINEHILAIVTKAFEQNPDIRWLHGKYQLLRGNIWVTIGKPFEASKLYRGMRSLAHQSMFVRKDLHDQYGLYKENISIAMDYDFVCRIAAEPMLFVPEPLIVFAPDGTSQQNYMESLKQNKQVYKSYFGSSLRLDAWQIRLKLLHYLLHSPVGHQLYKLKVALKMENV